MCDLKRATVEYIGFDRKKTSLDASYLSYTKKQLMGIRAVAMDEWDPVHRRHGGPCSLGRDKIVW